jgi:DDE family transposase
MTVFDALLAAVMPILQDIEQQRRTHGNETLRWLDFVRILVFFFTERCTSRNALVVALENADPALDLPRAPAMTLTDAFQRFPPTLLRQALSRFIQQIERPIIPELTLIGDIDAVDGSYFPVMGGMSYVRDTDTPRIKLHLDFNLSRLMAVDFVIGTATSNERQAYRTMLRENVTYVLDRGYMAFALLRDSIAAKAHVIMRACNNIVVETIEELTIDLPVQLRQHWTDIHDRRVRSAHEDAQGIEFRLVEFTVGPSSYKLITDRFDLSTFQVILIYAYRWQIELAFRFFKHTMKGLKVITQSHWGIENYFAGMFLTALLHLQFKIGCLEVDGYTARSTTDTTRTSEAMADDLATAALIDQHVQPSRDETRPSADSTGARFLARLNQPLALFWKIPKHWLATLADYLHRQFTSEVLKILNKRALANFKPT